MGPAAESAQPLPVSVQGELALVASAQSGVLSHCSHKEAAMPSSTAATAQESALGACPGPCWQLQAASASGPKSESLKTSGRTGARSHWNSAACSRSGSAAESPLGAEGAAAPISRVGAMLELDSQTLLLQDEQTAVMQSRNFSLEQAANSGKVVHRWS